MTGETSRGAGLKSAVPVPMCISMCRSKSSETFRAFLDLPLVFSF